MAQAVVIKVAGKIMLAGEYSVLKGHNALAMTVDRYLSVWAKASSRFIIESDLWSQPLIIPFEKLNSNVHLEYETKYQTVMHLLAYLNCKYNLTGVHIKIKSDLPPQFGLGSSSALRLALVTAISKFNNIIEPNDTALIALDIQRDYQGTASGYDVFTQSIGGLIEYTSPNNFQKKSLPNLSNYLHFYGKFAQSVEPTSDLIKQNLGFLKHNNHYEQLNLLNQSLIQNFNSFFSQSTSENYNKLVINMSTQRNLFNLSPCLPKIVYKLSKIEDCDKSWSFKTTGAGGSDLLLVLCKENSTLQKIDQTANSYDWQRLDLNPIDFPLDTEVYQYEYT